MSAFITLILSFTACTEALDGITMERKKLDDPGPDMSFEVALEVDSVVASQFEPVRVIVEDPVGKGQLGYTVAAPEIGSRRHKITLPESYKGKNGIFVVEFRKLNSGFDDIAALQDVPIALNLLKSRYAVFENKKIPGPSEKISLTINESDLLKLGYGPGGLTLKDIPGIPLIYFLNLVLSDEVKKYGFVYAGGVATSFVEDKYPPFTEIIIKLSDTNNIYGLSTTALDWALIMLPDVYTEGEDFSLWIYVKQPVEPDAEPACPCRTESCDCMVCPYELLGEYYGQDFYPIHIQVQTQEIGGFQIGDTLNISINDTDFLSCDELLQQGMAAPSPLSGPMNALGAQ